MACLHVHQRTPSARPMCHPGGSNVQKSFACISMFCSAWALVFLLPPRILSLQTLRPEPLQLEQCHMTYRKSHWFNAVQLWNFIAGNACHTRYLMISCVASTQGRTGHHRLPCPCPTMSCAVISLEWQWSIQAVKVRLSWWHLSVLLKMNLNWKGTMFNYLRKFWLLLILASKSKRSVIPYCIYPWDGVDFPSIFFSKAAWWGQTSPTRPREWGWLSGDTKPENRLFTQDHALQTKAMKDLILKELSSPSSIVLVVFPTVTMGMGVDIPTIRNIIHVGPPCTIREYFQETGQAGRDTRQSFALLYYNNRDIVKNREGMSNDIHQFCCQEDSCQSRCLKHKMYRSSLLQLLWICMCLWQLSCELSQINCLPWTL